MISESSIQAVVKSISTELEGHQTHLELLHTPIDQHSQEDSFNKEQELGVGDTDPLVPKTKETLFRLPQNPNLPSISKYISWVVEAGEIELEVLLIAYILQKRFFENVKPSTPINLYKLFSTSVFVA